MVGARKRIVGKKEEEVGGGAKRGQAEGVEPEFFVLNRLSASKRVNRGRKLLVVRMAAASNS